MIVCDLCFKIGAERVRFSIDSTEQWRDCCCECRERIRSGLMALLTPTVPANVRDLCPSLTPDQAERLAGLVARKAVEEPTP